MFATPKRSRLTHVLRLRISLIGVGLAGITLLASCGADPGSSATTLRPLTSTNYATTPPSVVTTVDPANTLPPAISYTIVSGDSVYAIAGRFGVALNNSVLKVMSGISGFILRVAVQVKRAPQPSG